MKALWCAFLVIFLPAVSSKTNKPHIIVILIDDLGWNDVGYHGSNQIKTPNIDALAYSGMILTRHYVLPTCTPSRTALLTGRYPIRTGMQGFPLKAGENRSLPASFKLQPQWLRDLGYRTHMVGKWHLGFETYNHVPNHRGFDTFFGYYNGFTDYYRYDYNQSLSSVVSTGDDQVLRGYDLHLNDDIYHLEKPIYATKLFADRASKVIQQHNPSEPLFLYLSHLATHTGNDEPMGMQMPEHANVNKTYHHIKDYGRRAFAGCLEELDRSVGTVMGELKKKNMLQNSIILVMSDNGAHTVSIDMAPNWSSNWPLSGIKFTMFEGGVRGAAVLWSPLLPKGFINYGFMHISDWVPTLYSAAGGNVEDLEDIDGVDQWQALRNVATVHRDNLLLNIDERSKAEGIIINDRWKVIKGGFANYANYDLHWGREANVTPNPRYNLTEVLASQTGAIIRGLPEFKGLLSPERMLGLRGKATVKCNPPDHGVEHVHGFIPASSNFRCSDFCVFDVLNDPCELNDLRDEEIISIGKKYLEDYKKKMILQKLTSVDVNSNPRLYGGAWMPWRFEICATSYAEEFAAQYLNVAIFISMAWYWLRKPLCRLEELLIAKGERGFTLLHNNIVTKNELYKNVTNCDKYRDWIYPAKFCDKKKKQLYTEVRMRLSEKERLNMLIGLK